jgi:hypothetical protein
MMPVSVLPAGGKAAPVVILFVLGVLAVSALANLPPKPAQQPLGQR